MQVNIHVISPGAENQEIRHIGQEFGIVLTGRFRLNVRNKDYFLNEGDSFSFDSNLPHSYANESDAVCRVLWVNTPPTF